MVVISFSLVTFIKYSPHESLKTFIFERFFHVQLFPSQVFLIAKFRWVMKTQLVLYILAESVVPTRGASGPKFFTLIIKS